MSKNKIIQFGAGAIGRSLVGQLFASAGWEVVFVDVVQPLVEEINRKRGYRIIIKEEKESEIEVSGIRALNIKDHDNVVPEIIDCQLVSTAVSPANLTHVAPLLADAVQQRGDPLDVILCENLRQATEVMRMEMKRHLPEDFPLDQRVGLIATSIGKMVPLMPAEFRVQDPLLVWAEGYNKIIADRDGFIGPIPKVEGLVVRGCFDAYVDLKLYIHNLGHATAAYLGDWYGARTISEAMSIAQVEGHVRGAMKESGRALVKLYPDELKWGEILDHIEDLWKRFHNPALGDTVYRVGRDRFRKYAPDDRLIGSLRADQTAGVEPTCTLETIAAGLFFTATDDAGQRLPADEDFDRLREEEGIRALLAKVSLLDSTDEKDGDLVARIIEATGRWGKEGKGRSA